MLAAGAAVLAAVHVAADPSHYAPFAAMARTRRWPASRASLLALACGLANAVSSFLAGFAGYAVGRAVATPAPSACAAAWATLLGGLAYTAWGMSRARGSAGDGHTHGDGGRLHSHDHIHDPSTGETIAYTPGILLAVFAFGPCLALAPILVVPAAFGGWRLALPVAAAFCLSLVTSMVAMTAAARAGGVPFRTVGRYGHALVGATITLAGCAFGAFSP